MVRMIRVDRGQIPLKGVSRRREPVLPMPKESDVQAAIVNWLRINRIDVLVTSRVRKRVRCSQCGSWSWPAGGDGVTKGLPDLFVRRSLASELLPAWPDYLWLGLEVKPYKGAKIRREQEALAQLSGLVIVYSVDDALQAVHQVDERLGCL